MGHIWLSGKTASDHNLLPELESYRRRARLRRAIEIIKLQNRIQKLKDTEEDPENSDMGDVRGEEKKDGGSKMHALGMFALSQKKQEKQTLAAEKEIETEARRKSFTGPSAPNFGSNPSAP